MPVVIRSEGKRLRSAISYAASACFHAGVLAWIILSGAAPERPRSLYEQEIRPFEKKLVWYRLSDKLPEIAPGPVDRGPLRTRVQAPQAMVAGARDEEAPSPLIHAPDPPVPAPKPLALPNLIAVAPPKPVRPFVAPPDIRREQTAPKLIEPPSVEAKLDVKPLPIDVKISKPAPRAFVPPSDRMARQAPVVLPEAPETRETVVEANALPWMGPALRPRPRDFVPPAAKTRAAAPVDLPAAPEVSAAHAPAQSALPKPFLTPPARPVDRSAPTLPAEAPAIRNDPVETAEITLAIVGLNPAKTREAPPPPPSRPAGFSAGPVIRKDGSSAAGNVEPRLNVPGLTVKGGPKDTLPALPGIFSATSRENLFAGARSVKAPPEPAGARVTEAPDPRLAGRVVYKVAIQMPNVTSFSGSWLVWFAEREPQAGGPPPDMSAPIPLRKVDPKYVASAVADRVEGSVRLLGVIQKDGHVAGISLIQSLDDRLDRTAQEALAKWEFTPAMRNGRPVDVDAVFEIPFRLAPRPTK